MTRLMLIAVVALTLSLTAGCASSKVSESVKQDITAQLLTRGLDLSGCYARALKRDRNVAGQMELTFKVNPRGELVDLAVGQTLITDAKIKRCVVKRLAGLKLTAPPKTALAVSYPLQFERQP